ncbi:hypothetical protein NUU61_003813 [Penicillium alfredii]|uniref:1,3-beta-glucanosyltransferase n=1 Tax=Penicillium alfredii TaxID=1506179 RepID=A0A9W9FJY5_9EURO|nr:uncharacterized protein NUU61_003813 [Penicillium alfredii]KAJ5101591.1 hypothetical protein NUU61_003813 [Penicillium alfredii]
MKYSFIAGLAMLGAALADNVPSIEVKGKKFFYSNNGTEFFIRGVAYQPDYDGRNGGSGQDHYTDPLADPESCKRDIKYLTELRTNVIRTYALNPKENHDECMNALADAGIYLISDLAEPGNSINQDQPTWDADLFTRYSTVVDAFAKYPNVIGFFAGNEVANQVNRTGSMAYVKAAVRDMKKYIKDKNYRSSLYIGYASDDDKNVREQTTNYLVCDDPSDSIDFYGYNIYEWCGKSSFHDSGYDERTKDFKDYPVPAFFSEYGCIKPAPRTFDDVPVLFGPKMNDVWSGGIVYMYFENGAEYGLVSTQGKEVKTLPDFSRLSSQIQKATDTGVNKDKYSVSQTVGRSCPKVGSDFSAASALPPSPDADLCSCMYDTLECRPKDDISDKDVDKNLGYLGGKKGVMDGVTGDASKGKYGAYSMCNAKQRLGFAMNAYYKANKGSAGEKACDFNGAGTTRNAAKASGSCSSQMNDIGPSGTGTVSGGGKLAASTGGGGGGSGDTSKAAGSTSGPQAVHVGALQAGFYVVAALASGAFMIML